LEQGVRFGGDDKGAQQLLDRLPIEDFDDIQLGKCSCGETLRVKDISKTSSGSGDEC